MGDNAFSLPTLLLIVPIAGALVSMSMLTRRAAAAASLLTFLVQSVLLVFGGLELHRFGTHVGFGYVPSCGQSAATKSSKLVLAQCSDWFGHWGVQYNVSLGWAAFWLVCLTTFVTGLACLFTFWADRERPAAMHGLFWIAAAALTGLFVARDLVLFYTFFELMLVPMLILVGVWGGAQRIRATLTMFIYTLVGSLPMLVGVVGVGMQTQKALEVGTRAAQLHNPSRYSLDAIAQLVADGNLHLSTWILVTFLLAFAIKAPLIPFHGWQPLAYRQAPAEVTAVLSGLISKAAYFGVLIVVLPLFPHQLNGGWGTALTWLAVSSLIYGCLAAFRAPDPRGVVAYSSLAQMGLILLGLTSYLGSGGAQGLGGAYLQTINHALVSAGLFMLIGIIEIRSGEREFSGLGALAKGRPRLLSITLVLTLITLAVPGASTFAGELLILAGVFRGTVSGPLIATIGCIAVVLAAMYALRLVAGTLMTTGDTDTDDAQGAETARTRFGGDLGATELFIVLPVVAVLIAISVWPHALHRGMDQPPIPLQIKIDPVADMKLASTSTKEGRG
jgi:NADH-quinone oxidoreductase subunit M